MLRRQSLSITLMLAVLVGCSGETTEPATTASPTPAPVVSALAAASAALGIDEIQTLTFSGTAWRVRDSFRQTRSASPPWPVRDTITNYQRSMDLTDLEHPVSRASGDTFASNLFLEPPVAGTYNQNVRGDQSAWGQQLEVWLTPWGFLKGAALYGATEARQTMDGKQVTAVTWQSPASQTSPAGLRYTVTGYINADNLVERVETRVEDAFMGDMLVAGVYSDYQLRNGLMAPSTMEQQRGGGGIFGVDVTAASVNPGNAAELLAMPAAPAPGGGAGGPPPAPAAALVNIGEGAYLVTAGYVAMVVEFADHLAVFEAGQSVTNGQLILDTIKANFPNKEIRYLVNSHPHSDHTAGIMPFVREGATIVTHENNVEFLNMALSTPRTLLGEATMSPKFMGAGSVTVLEDSTNRLEMHHIVNLHSDGMLVAYLPQQRVLFEADFTLPVGGAMPNPYVINLAEYVDTNGLDFDTYLAVHAAQVPQTKADLMATIGK